MIRPEVNEMEIEVASEAINEALGGILKPQCARNVAYRALTALRGASFSEEKDRQTVASSSGAA